ncbi:MAG: hypothetical protein CVU47_06985 [Chloroflexi bacterium HGW-Chloroflexi-9]|nr:MAG: hypothetical protein CVU47_06985 [Chloroflexi bacterium HGW-Chloroflexi-9]
MRLSRYLLIPFAVTAALALVACGEDDPAPATATVTATVSATASGTPTPTAEPTAEPVTGIPEVDVVIAAVEAKNLDALLALVEWQETACTTVTGQGAGGPPQCEAGQADGTVVRVFPIAGCEGYTVRDPGGEMFKFIGEVEALHSVVEAPTYARPAPWWPVGDYYVNFQADVSGEPVGLRLVVEDGKIVLIFFGCNHQPELLLQDGGATLPVIYMAPGA